MTAQANIPVTNHKKGLPTPEDYSGRAKQQAVFKEAIQHPTTLYPAAVSLLGVAYMLLVNLSPTSLGVVLVSGLLSVVSGIFHYFVRGETIAANYVKELNERRRLYKEQQVGDVEAECRAARFLEGQKEARELKQAYQQLYNFLIDKQQKKNNLTAGRFLILAEETYVQGVQFLRRALNMFNALKQIDKNKLEDEKKAFEKELKIQEAQKDDTRKPIIEALQAKLQSHEKRLKLYNERYQSMEQSLAQLEVLEAALDTAYLQVVDIIDDERVMQRSSMATDLERAVNAARNVEDRLRSIEAGPSEFDDSEYQKEN